MKNADFILLHFTDLLGHLKGRTIPSEEANKTLEEGVPFDGSSIAGGTNIEDSDMIMKPDLSTFTVCPHYFYDKSVATMLCDMKNPDGQPLNSDPRHKLKEQIERTSKRGYVATAAAELEFYLVKKDGQNEIVPVENHLMDKQRYFDIAPGKDLTEPYRMDLSNALATMGIHVERQHHEVGSAQNEITFKHSDPLTTADNIMRYKFAAKAVADRQCGWIATFMPKPWHGKAGSGMHIHLGLVNSKGENLFFDREGYAHVSQTCRYFVGGLLQHARALCSIVAPSVNSYKRLVVGYEAPVYVAWSSRNRSALVRIPAFSTQKGNEARIEFRCPDPLCNPYLAYSVILQAGMEGIEKKIEPADPVDTNIYHLKDTERTRLKVRLLPRSLKEALEEWKSDDICMQALGKEVAERYAELKMEEWQEYQRNLPPEEDHVSQWEIQKYLYD